MDIYVVTFGFDPTFCEAFTDKEQAKKFQLERITEHQILYPGEEPFFLNKATINDAVWEIEDD